MSATTLSLGDELAETVAKVRGLLPGPTFTAIADSIADLRDTGIAEQALGAGARPSLPSLLDARGEPHDLLLLLARGPLVLTFYRGGWCPYCNVTLRAWQGVLAQIRALGADFVAITPETPRHIEETSERASASFPILHDPRNSFARSLGLVFTLPEALRPLYQGIGIDLPDHNGEPTFSLPVPATYVIDRSGRVAYAFVDADFTRRAEPSEILQVLRALPGA